MNESLIQQIVPDGTRPPSGHYSPATVHGGLVYVSGQLPIDPVTGMHQTGSVEEQTELVLKNLATILDAAGSSMNHVLQVTIYTSDISLWSRINAVYAMAFGEHRPARIVVPTAPLHYGLLVELSTIAAQCD